MRPLPPLRPVLPTLGLRATALASTAERDSPPRPRTADFGPALRPLLDGLDFTLPLRARLLREPPRPPLKPLPPVAAPERGAEERAPTVVRLTAATAAAGPRVRSAERAVRGCVAAVLDCVLRNTLRELQLLPTRTGVRAVAPRVRSVDSVR